MGEECDAGRSPGEDNDKRVFPETIGRVGKYAQLTLYKAYNWKFSYRTYY